MTKENIIISLGGSLVAPDGIDTAFLKVFKNAIKKNFTSKRFFILSVVEKFVEVIKKHFWNLERTIKKEI